MTSPSKPYGWRKGTSDATNPPLRWLGGKYVLAPWIIGHFPPHHTYVEPFGGAAHVLLAKPPSPVEVYADVDGRLVNFFRVLRDPEKAARLQELLRLTPYAREEFRECSARPDEGDEVERARRFFVSVRMSFAGIPGNSWGYARRTNQARTTARVVDNLMKVAERFRHVQVDQGDFREVIPRWDSPETLFYCDPPYVPSTRRSGEYAHEMSLEDHRALVELLLRVTGMVVLSGYPNELYLPLERAGWKRVERTVIASAVGRTRGSAYQGAGALAQQRRVEALWLSPRTLKGLGLA